MHLSVFSVICVASVVLAGDYYDQDNWKCGKRGQICPDSSCCSEYGWCGWGSEYCGKGCQPQYGRCDGVKSSTKKSSTFTKATSTKGSSSILSNTKSNTKSASSNTKST